jgi:hypothetical protein
MAICIEIRKYNEDNNVYVYEVNNLDETLCNFFVVLCPKNNKKTIYEDRDLKQLLRVVDLNNTHELISVPGIAPFFYVRVIMRCMRALRENHFPERMGYCA